MSFFCNPFLLQRHQFFLDWKPKFSEAERSAAGAAGICGSSLLSFLSDIGFSAAAAAEQGVSEGVRKGEMGAWWWERSARERERSHVISSLCACFLASSSASSSSLWSPKTERKRIIEEQGVVLPAAAEAGAESRWKEARKEAAVAAAHSELRSNRRRIFFFFGGSSFSFTFSTTWPQSFLLWQSFRHFAKSILKKDTLSQISLFLKNDSPKKE